MKYALHDACTFSMKETYGVFQPTAYANVFDYAGRLELFRLILQTYS